MLADADLTTHPIRLARLAAQLLARSAKIYCWLEADSPQGFFAGKAALSGVASPYRE
jgi:hypothetical protein